MISGTAPVSATVGTLGAGARAALACAGVWLFYTGLDNYAYRWWSSPAPITFILLFVAGAAALAILNARAPMNVLRSPFLLWVLGYFLMTSLWALWSPGSAAVIDAVRERYRSVGFLVAFAVIFDDPRARRAGVMAIAAALVVASCLNVAELFGLVQLAGEEYRVPGRAAGLYVNPNGAGLVITLGLAVVLHRVPPGWRIPLLAAGAAGVATTFSRGAGLCLAILVLYLVWRRDLGGWPVVVLLVVTALLLATREDGVVKLLDAHDVLTPETLARLRFAQPDSGRGDLALVALRQFLDSPFVGNGVAATVQAHNQFLTLAGDHGVLGLVALPALAWALRGGPGAPFAIVLLLAGLFSHNLLDDRASLILIALSSARDPGAPAG